MEDFLIGREVISRSDPGRTASDASVTLPPLEHAPPAPTDPEVSSPQNETGAHGTRIETVVERGRVTKLIVTCTCGNVTEIECRY
ncbi:MAG: hypothetical protein DRP71_02365 [Verrucomicrobia bacterium]|nr:MAG: hypothetical protein DRP71_02365 [Verrucomicrobiota bacterium]